MVPEVLVGLGSNPGLADYKLPLVPWHSVHINMNAYTQEYYYSVQPFQ